MKEKFYICRQCGNMVGLIKNSGVPVKCCGQNMEALVPNVTDGAEEKHIPCCEIKDNKLFVKIGEVPHPMIEQHFIEWIYAETENGIYRKILKPGDKSEAVFCIGDEKLIAVYEYCNIHGLWKKDMNSQSGE